MRSFTIMRPTLVLPLAGVVLAGFGAYVAVSFASAIGRHARTTMDLLVYFEAVGLGYGVACLIAGIALLTRHTAGRRAVAAIAVMTWPFAVVFTITAAGNGDVTGLHIAFVVALVAGISSWAWIALRPKTRAARDRLNRAARQRRPPRVI